MTRLRTLHAIAAILCGLAIAAVLLDAVRVALAAMILVFFAQIWSLETLRFALHTSRREIRK